MAGELIFVTGASGFVGSVTAVEALKSGYRLRVCLRRSCEKLESLLLRYSKHVEFVIVPELTQAGLSGELDGIDYVLHVASPVPHGTNKEFYYIPAVRITMAALEEAASVSSVKKVVITSSVASLLPIRGPLPGAIVEEDNEWNLEVDEAADFTIFESPAATATKLYHASKLLANKATWEFWEHQRPHYSLVVMHPGFTFGHKPMQTNAEELQSTSNEGLWLTIMEGTLATSLTCVHVQDIAEAHIRALSPNIPDCSSYLLVGHETTWKEGADIVHRNYPESNARITAYTEPHR
ncbi:hypothetical protein N7490_001726 [Penicillium lividum]|nr:hypothetical protein N7490_001726 [Penicillium lividum]